MNTYYTCIEIDEPMGTLTISSNGEAITGIYMQDHRHGPITKANWIQDSNAAPIPEAVRQLMAYFAGELKKFNLPLAPEGTPFQQMVWTELTRIPYGETISYGELATRIGNSNASRAVGLSNGRNPISIVVPCHRVIGANGKLVGYGGGLNRKVWLLNLERGVRTYNAAQMELAIVG